MLPTRNSTLSRFTRLTRRALFPFPLRTAAASRKSTTDATSASQPPLRVAVVGSGPAGMYVTTSLLKKLGEGVRVDVIDKLPTPFGLVRSGVAPDHADTKNVTHQFDRALADGRVSFWGGVAVAEREVVAVATPSSLSPSAPLSIPDLRRLYSVVVLAHGAEGDARLSDVPGGAGEAAPASTPTPTHQPPLRNVLSARDFVLWVNGHPDRAGLGLDLSKTHAVTIVGLGNVALDCARLLLRGPGDLDATDAAPAALEALRLSGVRAVHVLARRGPPHAACTAAELREALHLPGVGVTVHPDPLPALTREDEEALAARGRGAKRVAGLLAEAASRKGATADGSPPAKALHLHFYTAPSAYEGGAGGGDGTAVAAVTLRRTTRTGAPAAGPVPPGQGGLPPPLPLPSSLVLEAVGFRTRPLSGVPWDPATSTVPSGPGGRVVEEGGQEGGGVKHNNTPSPPPLAPLYVTGWARRGPSGIIGSNAADGADVAGAIVADAGAGKVAAGQGSAGLATLLGARGAPPAVTAAGWRAIDDAEQAAGAALPANPPRVKLTEVGAMRGVAEAVAGGVRRWE